MKVTYREYCMALRALQDKFDRRILITEFTVSPGGGFTAWYEDDDMFWGHVVTVDGILKKGPIGADMQG